MNICFITSDNVNPIKGGVERVVYNLSNIFMRKGHVVIYFSKEKNEYSMDNAFFLKNDKILADENKEYFDFLIKKYCIDIIVYASHHEQMFDLALFLKNKNRCKLVTALYMSPDAPLKSLIDDFAIVRFYEKRVIKKIFLYIVLTLGFGYRFFCRLRDLKKNYLYKYNHSNAFVVEAASYVGLLKQLMFIKDKNKIYDIPNPISNFRKEYRYNKKKQILYIARMNLSQKRPDRMLRIWGRIYKKFPDWNLLMVGDGVDKIKMMDYADKLKLKNVEFIGQSVLDDLYSESEIFCMTSTYEGFGLVLVESIQNSVIPIAFNSYRALEDILGKGLYGVLVSPFSERQYALFLSKMMSDSSFRKNIRENMLSVDLDGKYGEETIYNKWMNLFNQI